MGDMLRKVMLLWSAGVLVCIFACASYRAKPLDEQSITRTLGPPDLSQITVQAKELKHPLLKPVTLDLEKGLTPEAAAVLAVLANPTLRALRTKKGVASAQLLQAGILPNPQLSYSFDTPTGGSTEGTVNAFGVGLSYDLIPLITRPAQIEAARAEAASVDLDIAWQEWQMALTAKTHVYNLVFLEEQTTTAEKQEKTLRDNVDTLKKAFATGDATEIELAAAQTSLEKVHASNLVLQQQYQQERLALNQTMGFPPQQVIPLREGTSPPLIEIIPSLEEMISGIQDRRLDLIALRLGYQSQEARVRAAVLSQFPALVLGLSHSRDTTNVITTGFTIGISIPVFNRNQGQIAIETASRQQLFDEYLARLYDARSAVATILANMSSVEKQVDTAEKILPVVEKLVETYRMALLEGHADVLTYYNTLNDFYSMQLNLLALRKNLSDLIVSLEIASGRFLVSTTPGEAGR